MATPRFWVGGTGNWSDSTNHWANSTGGAPGVGNLPVAGDNVTFDGSSGTGTCTIDSGSPVCANFNCSTSNITFTTNTNLSIGGSLNITATPTISTSGQIWIFTSTSAGNTITTNGVTIGPNVTFTGPGGTWTLSGNCTLLSNRDVILTAGNLDLGGFTLTSATFVVSGVGVKTLTYQAGGMLVLLANTATIITTSGSSNFSTAGATGTIKSTGTGARIFAGNSLDWRANVWNACGSSNSTFTFTGSNTFADLKDDGTGAHSILFTASTTTTLTSMTISNPAVVTIGSVTAVNHNLVTTGQCIVNNCSISRSTATQNKFIALNSTNGGNNTGWVFGAANGMFAGAQ